MSVLRLQLLGMPSREILNAGQRRLGYKPLLLLSRLLLEPRPMTREAMMAFLWPEASEDHARGSLRQALHVLRVVVGPDGFDTDRRWIGLQTPPVCDLTDFLQAVRHSDWRHAALAYTGPLLEGVTVHDASDAELWLDVERRRIGKLFETAAIAALEEHHLAMAPHDRLEVARRLRDHGPRQIRSWRLLFDVLVHAQNEHELRLERAALAARVDSQQIDDAGLATAMLHMPHMRSNGDH